MDIFRSLLSKQPKEAERPKPQLVVAKAPEPEEEAVVAPADFVERRLRKRIDARRGTKILIIDDSATVLAVMKRYLTSIGYITFEALDAESGIEMLHANKPDLIFLDIILPKMDGFAALRHIRRDPETAGIPVIMMSGNELAAEQYYANRIGADDFMKKPFTRREVFARIEPLLDDMLIPRHVKRTQAITSQATA